MYTKFTRFFEPSEKKSPDKESIMSRPSRSWLQSGLKACLCWLCLGVLLALTPGAAWAYTESISVGLGTLSWTLTVSTYSCAYGETYTEYQYSNFSFTSSSGTQSLGGGAVYFQSGCGSYCPPTGPQPSSLTLTGNGFTITFYPQSGGGGSATYQTTVLPT